MDGPFVLQGNNPQDPSCKLRHYSPKSKAVVLLRFHFKWILEYSDAPVFIEIWSFPQDLFLKILREFIFFLAHCLLTCTLNSL